MPNQKQTEMKKGAALLSVCSNTLLVIIKLIAGILTGSVAILSDAVHSLVDLGASIIALTAVRRSANPPDREHRYGHSRFEDLSASLEAVLLLFGAAIIAEEAIRRFITGGTISDFGFGLVVIGVAALVNLLVSYYLKRIAHKTDSVAIAADGTHLSTDALTSLGVFISLLLVKLTGAEWIDPVFALIVALMITYTGLKILFGSSRRLIDTSLPPEEMVIIETIISQFIANNPLVISYHDLRTRQSGADREIDLHLQFINKISLYDAHWLTHNLQDEIIAQLPWHTNILIHMEPEDRTRPDSFTSITPLPKQIPQKKHRLKITI